MSEKITIQLPVTIHAAGPNWKAPKTRAATALNETIAIPPGTPFVIEEAEGRRLVKRHGGVISAGSEP